MKVAHCTAWFVPESFGGTEIYVASLAKELSKAGVDQAILVPRSKPGLPDESVHEGLRVLRFDPGGFEQSLRTFSPDLCHLHTWTSTAGLHELRLARRRGVPVIFTFHNVSPVCATDTLMRFGQSSCDGVIRDFTCSTCYLYNRGYSRTEADMYAMAAAAMAPFYRAPDSSTRWRTLASLFADFSRRKTELTELSREAAALVVPAKFIRQALADNGVPMDKLVICRQGVAGGEAVVPNKNSEGTLRIGFVGRLDPAKGPDIIAEAVHALPESADITLEIIGPEGGVPGTRRDPTLFLNNLHDLAQKDPRIRILGLVPHEQMRQRMASFDVLAVPSRWQETGPMTAMEAIALGVPVIGSDLGGIPETVKDGVNGRIVASLDPGAWARVLTEILGNRETLLSWKSACAPGRTMADVASEMVALYRKCLAKNS